MPTKLYFKPWVGSRFSKEKNKLLLLGESHYDKHGNASPDFTCELVQEMIDGERYPYFVKVATLLDEHPNEIWNDIAFANIFQRVMANGSAQPINSDWETIKNNFNEIMNFVKPRKLIVLSKRIWENLPEEDSEIIEKISVNVRSSNIFKYYFPHGDCYAIGINHPSRMYGNKGTPAEWKKLVQLFLQWQPH
jgi:hypothetical protein